MAREPTLALVSLERLNLRIAGTLKGGLSRPSKLMAQTASSEAVAARTCSIDTLPTGLLAAILAQLSSTQAQLGAARTCRSWRALCTSISAEKSFAIRAFVTLAAENRIVVLDEHGQTVQSFEPMPPSRSRRGKHGTRARGHWRTCKHLYRWPTCLALGPAPGSLYVSQYRVRGVLRYDTDPTGTTYHYTRVAASDQALESPEGIVANADGSLFVASAIHGTVNHVSVQGTILRTWSCAAWTRDRSPTGSFRVPWGMCRGPDRALYVAVHSSDGGDYIEPTPRDTGDILRLELDGGGVAVGTADPLRFSLAAQEFQSHVLCGEYWQVQERPSQLNGNVVAEVIREEFEFQRAANPGLGLNRPSNPCFWLPSQWNGAATCAVENDGHCPPRQLKPVLLVSSFRHQKQVLPQSCDNSTAATSTVLPEPSELSNGPITSHPSRPRGIAVFNACIGTSDTSRHATVSQCSAAVQMSAAAAIADWRPWGVCAHGRRVFATGHAGGALDESSEDAGVKGCVKVWEAGRWWTLRAGLREPNYILVC